MKIELSLEKMVLLHNLLLMVLEEFGPDREIDQARRRAQGALERSADWKIEERWEFGRSLGRKSIHIDLKISEAQVVLKEVKKARELCLSSKILASRAPEYEDIVQVLGEALRRTRQGRR